MFNRKFKFSKCCCMRHARDYDTAVTLHGAALLSFGAAL